jgi:hypothetical protein
MSHGFTYGTPYTLTPAEMDPPPLRDPPRNGPAEAEAAPKETGASKGGPRLSAGTLSRRRGDRDRRRPCMTGRSARPAHPAPWPTPFTRLLAGSDGEPVRSAGASPRPRTVRAHAKPTYVSLLAISSTFNFLFKVLFTFPSQYFCAIGFPAIFSFGWDLPPFKAAFSSNSTLSRGNERENPRTGGRDFHPPRSTVPGHLARAGDPYCCENPGRKPHVGSPTGGSQIRFELCPLHSPLLRASLLVSFPPLNNMLKFGGWPCPIRGRRLGMMTTTTFAAVVVVGGRELLPVAVRGG